MERPGPTLDQMRIRISDSQGRAVQPDSYKINKDGIKVQLPTYNLTQEIANIDRIRNIFDDELNTDTRHKLLSWDPVKSRNRFEQCQTREEQLAWQRNETEEITTSLRERYNSLENPMDLFIDEEGFLRNNKFPIDTLETILRRGVMYQETHGSKELARERCEVEGILKVQADLTSSEAQDGDTRLIFSPPGMVEGSPYTKHFVDTYTLRVDPVTGERKIDAKRYATAMSYEDYQEAALSLDPTYFDDKEGPLDAILLGNPLNLDGIGDISGFLEGILLFDQDALRGYEFEVINKVCEPIKPYLVQAIINFEPRLIARILNTMFHMGDEMEALLKEGNMEKIEAMLRWTETLGPEDIMKEVSTRGKAYVEPRQVGCGDSGSLENSVGQYGIGGAENDPNLRCLDTECKFIGVHFHCPGEKSVRVEEDGRLTQKNVACKEVIRVGRGITVCPTCGEGKRC